MKVSVTYTSDGAKGMCQEEYDEAFCYPDDVDGSLLIIGTSDQVVIETVPAENWVAYAVAKE